MELKLYDPKGKKTTKSIALPEVFKIDDKKNHAAHILYEVTRAYLINQRQGTASTKTRGEVDGGSKKPWRQKHTGNARAGSIRSPLWRKGGIIFGPKPKKWHIDVPRAKKRLALRIALAEKIKEDAIIAVENFSIIEGQIPKTKFVADFLKKVGISDNSKPIILSDIKIDPVLQKSLRNIPNLEYKISGDLNAYDILHASRIIITSAALEALISRIAVQEECSKEKSDKPSAS